MRTRGALAVAAFATALSGCGAVPAADSAATVGDDVIAVDELEATLRTLAENSESSGVLVDAATGTVGADVARNVLTFYVRRAATEQFLATAGESITEADRQAVLAQIPDGSPELDFPDEVLGLLVDVNAAPTARARVPAPDAAEIQRRYEREPASLAVLCVRHVLVDSESDAEDVLDELAAGASIEDLARERSVDPTAVDNGGAIELTPGEPCAPVGLAREQLDGAFVDGALRSRPGRPIGPVQTQFGWHVIEARPFEDVEESLSTLLATSAGELLFEAYVSSLDVQVDPRYGRWDPATAGVVTL